MNTVKVEIAYYHSTIRSRAWVTRRLNELVGIVRVSATLANPCGGQMMMDVGCHMGFDNTVALLFLNEFDDSQVQALVRHLNSHERIIANICASVPQPACHSLPEPV